MLLEGQYESKEDALTLGGFECPGTHWKKSRPSRSSWAENVMVELGVIPGMRLTRVSVLS